jgi:hypothetical protein
MALIPISLNYYSLVRVKTIHPALLSIPIASYYSIERLRLIYFPYAQQDHKLNKTGITTSLY